MVGAAGANGAFHDDLTPAWDHLFRTNRAVVDTINGEHIDPTLDLPACIRAIHAAAVEIHQAIFTPDALVAMFDQFPLGAFAFRLGTTGFADDVKAIWQACSDALRARYAGWPEPVDILTDTATAPVLTAEHVPAVIWAFAADSAARMGAAPSSLALAAIVACSSAISEAWEIQPKKRDVTWTEQARLWGALVGPPSTMKSPVIAVCTKPVEVLNMRAHDAWKDAMAAYKVAHKAWKDGSREDPEPMPPRKARHLVESATIEALQEVLRDDAEGKMTAPLGKVLVRQDELAEFLANMDRYTQNGGSGDRGAYLRIYNGGPFSVDRIGRGSFFTKSWSGCILGGIQPEPIQRIADKADNDGLLQRFMFDVPGPATRGEDRQPDFAALANYRDLFPALVAMRPTTWPDTDRPAVVQLHQDGHIAREDIDALATTLGMMPDASTRLQSAFGKWPGLFARLCLTFHLIEIAAARAKGEIGPHPEVVTAETARMVQNYMRAILAPNLLRADGLMFTTRQSGHAEWIAGYILAHKSERVTARQIAKDYGALRAPEQRRAMDEIMESLDRLGWVLAEPSTQPGKPPTAWTVNPRAHLAYARRAEVERKRRNDVKETIAAYVASLGRAGHATH